MFAPISRSKVAHQNICPSCLSALYRRLCIPRGQNRYNSTAAAETPSIGDHDPIILSRLEIPSHIKVKKRKETRSATKQNAPAKALRRKSLSTDRKAIATLKAALMEEDKSNDAKSTQPCPKEKRKAAEWKTKPVVEKIIPGTSGVNDADSGGENSSRDTGKLHDRGLKAAKASKAKELSGKATKHEAKSELSSRSKTSGMTGSLKEAPTEDLAEARMLPTAALTRRVSSTGAVLSKARRLRSRSRLNSLQVLSESKSVHSGPKISKTTRNRHQKNQSGVKGVGVLDVLTKEALVRVVRANKLSSEDKKLFMGRLRHTLLSGQIKTGDIVKKASAPNAGSRLLERANSSAEPEAPKKIKAKTLKKIKAKAGMAAYEIKTVEAADLHLVPLEKPQPPVPNLAYGLERVLFNPGVYQLRDPRSRVFNFDPYLESIMPVAEFDFNALKEYITSSRDETLISTAAAERKKYSGSTSSMTSALAHFHFLLSQWRPVNISNLSQGFPEKLKTFTQLQRTPSAIFLRWRNGTYAIDADKEFDTANVLMMLGKSMEKLLTLPTEDFEKYRKENSNQISEEERNEAESFHYTTMGDFLMRSQLDAHDPRIPGTGMFDLKTRAVVSIRMDARNHENGLGYEIRNRYGAFESYEREYYDMIRAAFLKYSLQVRMGRMDGIFVAFHNTERIFGFQYISLPEMDFALHGQDDITTGDSEFKLSLHLLNRVLDRATAKFPKQSLRLFFETRETATPFMYIFAEPITEEDIQQIQDTKKAEIEEYERKVLGISQEPTREEVKDEEEKSDWEELQAKVEESMDDDELESLDEDESPNEVTDHVTVDDSDGYNGLSIHETRPDTSVGIRDECLIGLRSEMEEVHEDGAEIERDLSVYTQNDEIIEDGTNEQKRHEQSRIDAEGEEGSEGYQDAQERTAEAGDVHNSNNSNVDQPTADKLIREAPDLTEMDSQSQSEVASNSRKSNLLAMTLTIRNKVNGVYVVRPEKLGPKDRWSVEYALAEVPKAARARALYEKTKRRRELVLKRDKTEAKSNFTRSYARRLMELSSQGRKWREEQDKLDRTMPMKVLGGSIAGAQPNDPSQ
jgi:hypothetical protein